MKDAQQIFTISGTINGSTHAENAAQREMSEPFILLKSIYHAVPNA